MTARLYQLMTLTAADIVAVFVAADIVAVVALTVAMTVCSR